MENLRTRDGLRSMQAAPLSVKVAMTKQRIREWVREYGEDGVCVSFSGGKDSTVLSHLVDEVFPGNRIPRVHVRTGLEYPEIEKFCEEKTHDLVIIRPEKTFKQVIQKYGYPFISKEVSEAVAGARRYIELYLQKELNEENVNEKALTDSGGGSDCRIGTSSTKLQATENMPNFPSAPLKIGGAQKVPTRI